MPKIEEETSKRKLDTDSLTLSEAAEETRIGKNSRLKSDNSETSIFQNSSEYSSSSSSSSSSNFPLSSIENSELSLSEQQNATNVVDETNTAVDKLYPNIIVRLDTSALFSQKNLNGISKIFDLMAKENDQFSDLIGDDELSTEDKKFILQILNNSKIQFTFTNSNGSSIPNIFKDKSFGQSDKYLSIRDPDENNEINLEDDRELLARGSKIQLSAQLYHHAYKMIIIDDNREKCPTDKEFHEKIHLLDDCLSHKSGEMHSVDGFLSITSGVSKEKQTEILQGLIKIVIPLELSDHYVAAVEDRKDGIKFGATEILAFTLQSTALCETIDLSNLDSKQTLVLKSILDSFQQGAVKQDSLSELSSLCLNYSSNLDKISKSKSTSEELALLTEPTINQSSSTASSSSTNLDNDLEDFFSTLEGRNIKTDDQPSKERVVIGNQTQKLADRDLKESKNHRTFNSP